MKEYKYRVLVKTEDCQKDFSKSIMEAIEIKAANAIISDQLTLKLIDRSGNIVYSVHGSSWANVRRLEETK